MHEDRVGHVVSRLVRRPAMLYVVTALRPRVLVVGEVLCIFLGEAAESPQFHGPYVSGAPMIFAGVAARLGADVRFAGSVGDDLFGRSVTRWMTAHGMSTDLLVVDAHRPTAVAFAAYAPDGSRDFVFHVASSAATQVGPEVLDRVDGPVDWLHVSGSALAFGGATAETTWRSVETAIGRGTPISFDPNVRKEAVLDEMAARIDVLADHAAVVLASAGELESLGIDESRVVGRGAVVCRKAGAAGVRVVDAQGSTRVAAPGVEEVDPDGAGDVFAAGFVVATLAGHPPVVAAQVGARVAAESVQKRGPLTSDVRDLATYLG